MSQMSIRLSAKAEQMVDDLVAEGAFENRTAVVRAALNLLLNAEKEKKQGRRIVAIDEEKLRELGLAVQMTP